MATSVSTRFTASSAIVSHFSEALPKAGNLPGPIDRKLSIYNFKFSMNTEQAIATVMLFGIEVMGI